MEVVVFREHQRECLLDKSSSSSEKAAWVVLSPDSWNTKENMSDSTQWK